MSPVYYVLLLIGSWLLLASTTLWGILRVTRRHYLEFPHAETDLPTQPIEQQDEPAYARVQLLNQAQRAMIVIARLPLRHIAQVLTLHRRISAD